MNKVYKTLEFDQIKNLVQGYCVSEQGKQHIASLCPFDNKDELEEQFLFLKDAMNLIRLYGRFPLSSFYSITTSLEVTKKEGTLSGDKVNGIRYQLQNISELKSFVEDKENQSTVLVKYIQETYCPTTLYQMIIKCIDSNGVVQDNASSELRSIRRSIQAYEANIRTKITELQAKYRDYLSQETTSIRNDHYVLPVKAGNRNQVKGIVHALSASGQTMYIEPDAIVQINNQIFQLRNDEKKEVQRILFSISQEIKNNAPILEFNQEILIYLDSLLAKASYAAKLDCVIPTIGSTHVLQLTQARHPLIDPKDMIANDIVLMDPKTMMLISGSNTGGKTVVLKTAGLLSLMALSGLAVPCNQASIPFFDQIFVDLGDEQSIEQSLSTFSSHMSRLVSICEEVTSHSLVLLDEIGSGTDPREGESIAQAILTHLHHKNALTIASTHYSGLKQFAKKEEYIQIAAVEFDQEQMCPTYRLLIGNVGNSYAIEISKRLGLQASIVENAYRIKEDNLSVSDKLLEKLQDELTTIQKQKDDLEAKIKEADFKLEKYNQLVNGIDSQREQILIQAKQEANNIYDEAKQYVDMVIEEMKTEQAKMHVPIEAKHKLDTLKHVEKKKEAVSTTPNHHYVIGDIVLLISMNRQGEVVSINKKGILTIDIGGLKVNLKPSEVQFLKRKEKTKLAKSNARSLKKTTNQSYELNIIGQRYEEAMIHLDKFLDDAIVHNYSSVRIVHGIGSGVLRKGVRKMLDKNKNIVSYRDGGANEGGLGATLAYFE